MTNINPLSPDTNIIHDTTNEEETVIRYQPPVSQDSIQIINNPVQSLQGNTMNNPNESLLDNENISNYQTGTSQITQDTTESLQDTITNQPTVSTVTDPNALQVPIHYKQS